MSNSKTITQFGEGTIRIKLSNGSTMVAEPSADPENPGIVFCMEDSEGAIYDVAYLESTDDKENNSQGLRLLVWSDPYDEDYTHEHKLPELANGWDTENHCFKTPSIL